MRSIKHQRLRRTFTGVAVTLLFLCACSGWAADDDGRFHGMGAGLATCERFVHARSEQSSEYFMFGGWMDGYISARNQLDRETFSLAPWQTTDVLAGFLADYCDKHPKEQFLRAVLVMVEALRADRLVESSQLMGVRVGSFKADYFKATLEDLQRALAELGFYNGEVSGNFNEETALAVRAYQARAGLEETGFPDQLTLFRIFHDGT